MTAVTASTRGPWRVERVAETGSTNADVLVRARADEPEGLVLVAGFQTAGRGRLGRTWIAPPGASLLCSVLLRPELHPGSLHRLTQAVGVAAARAAGSLAGVEPDLKWPNDLYVGDRKLAGILAEAVVDAGRVTAVVVGIGINVARPAEVPAEIADRGIWLDDITDRPVDVDGLLDAFLDALAGLDWPGLTTEYRRRLGTIGKRVRVDVGGTVFEGDAVDVTVEGALVVALADGTRREVSAGDVTTLRLA